MHWLDQQTFSIRHKIIKTEFHIFSFPTNDKTQTSVERDGQKLEK